MDISSAFKSEILRPITTVVVPGALAVGPFVSILGYYIPAIPVFWTDHPTAFSTIAVFCILAAGLILEDLGSLIESTLWDPILQKRYPTWEETWNSYLQLELRDEIVGQRYLKSIVGRLKFELSMVPGLLAMTVGVGWMNGLWRFWPWSGFVAFAAFILALAGYLLRESFNSTVLLAKKRPFVVEAAKKRAQGGQKSNGA